VPNYIGMDASGLNIYDRGQDPLHDVELIYVSGTMVDDGTQRGPVDKNNVVEI
jgi:hypothetical protein